MTNKLDAIIQQKQLEVGALYELIRNNPQHLITRLFHKEYHHHTNKSLRKALVEAKPSVIAEIKRKSPSKGNLAEITDPVSLAKSYIEGGANALSVLTDHTFFGGSLNDLKQISLELKSSAVPLLRKDFIIDSIQIAEAAHAGADAILAIVAVLGSETQVILKAAHEFGLEVLVEVHNEIELEIALDAGAAIIGINNRNLKNFEIDTELGFKLIQKIPNTIVTVAESGIREPKLVREYYQAGFNAVLIGETLVRSKSPKDFIKECQNE